MATIVTRTGKGSPLTNAELDANFTNLNAALTGVGGTAAAIPGLTTATIDDQAIAGGLYYVTATNTGTKPSGDDGYGHLLVSREGAAGTTARQTYFDNISSAIWTRTYAPSAWSAWRQLAFLDSVKGRTIKSVAGSANVTLTATETDVGIISFIGALTGNINVIFPAASGIWWIENYTSGAFTLTLKTAAGTVLVPVTQGKVTQVVCNSTDVLKATDFVDIALTGTPTVPTAAAGTNTTQAASTAFVAAAVASAGGGVGYRNRVINGDMRVDQHNFGAAVTINSTGTFIVDRYQSLNNTGTGTITGQQSTLSGKKSAKLTATAAITDLTAAKYFYGLLHIFEALNVYDLNNGNVTVSFQVETNWTGNLAVALRNPGLTRSYVTNVAVVAGVNQCSVTVPLEATTVATNDNGIGLWLSIGSCNEATLQTTTANAWVAGNYLTLNTSTQWAKTTGNYININELQLEAGSSKTAFERIDYGESLARCQRYYWKMMAPAAPVSSANNSTVVQFTLPRPMRAAPTLTHNLTNANYVATLPTGDQWNLQAAGIAYSAKSGTAGFLAMLAPAGNVNCALAIYTATFSQTPTWFVSGSTAWIEYSAEF